MSKYIKSSSISVENSLFMKSGIIILCFYIAAAFPGTRLFGSLPVQRVSLLLLLAHGVIGILCAIKTDIHTTTHMLWYGFFTLISFISLIMSGGELNNNDFHAVIICFVLTVIHSIYVVNKSSFKYICWSYIIVCLLNTIILIANNELVMGAGERLGDRLDVNPNVLATFFMYGIIYAIWLYYIEEKKKKKIIILILGLTIMYPLILTGGRKFFLAPILYFTIVLFMNNSHIKYMWIRNIIVICALFCIMWYLIMTIPALYNSLGNRFEGLLNSITGKGNTEISAEVRRILRKLAIEGWLNSPIWGNGFDTFKYYSADNGQSLFYSHCNFTELLYSGGIVYFMSYYWLFGMLLWKCFKDKTISIKRRSLCFAGVIMQLFFDYGGVSYNTYHSQLFMLMIFCYLYDYKNTSLVMC